MSITSEDIVEELDVVVLSGDDSDDGGADDSGDDSDDGGADDGGSDDGGADDS